MPRKTRELFTVKSLLKKVKSLILGSLRSVYKFFFGVLEKLLEFILATKVRAWMVALSSVFIVGAIIHFFHGTNQESYVQGHFSQKEAIAFSNRVYNDVIKLDKKDVENIESRVMRVGVLENPPFSFYNEATSQWDGLDVEVFQAVASELNIAFEISKISLDRLEQDLENGKFDILFGGFKYRDPMFLGGVPVSYLDSSLAIASDQTNQEFSRAFFALLISKKLWLSVLILLVILTLSGAAISRFESSDRNRYNKNFFSKLWGGFIWSLLIFSAIGADMPRSRGAKIFGVVWIFVTIFASAGIIGSVSSSLTLQQMEPIIQSPQDLRHVTVGAAKDTQGSNYLKKHHINYLGYNDLDEAIEAAHVKEVTAVVSDEIALRFALKNRSVKDLSVIPLKLTHEPYVFVFPQKSPFLIPFKKALHMFVNQDPSWHDIVYKYLGYVPQLHAV